MAASAAAPAVICKNVRRGSFKAFPPGGTAGADYHAVADTRNNSACVGWATALGRCHAYFSAEKMMGTLRFAHPTGAAFAAGFYAVARRSSCTLGQGSGARFVNGAQSFSVMRSKIAALTEGRARMRAHQSAIAG